MAWLFPARKDPNTASSATNCTLTYLFPWRHRVAVNMYVPLTGAVNLPESLLYTPFSFSISLEKIIASPMDGLRFSIQVASNTYDGRIKLSEIVKQTHNIYYSITGLLQQINISYKWTVAHNFSLTIGSYNLEQTVQTQIRGLGMQPLFKVKTVHNFPRSF